MQVDTTRLSPPTPVTAPAPVRQLPQADWQPGQVLRAIVISTGPDARTLLAVEGRAEPIEVRGSAPLVAGQQIRLVVELNGSDLALRLLRETAEPEQAGMLAGALRTALPKQTPLQPLLERLAGWAREGGIPDLKEALSTLKGAATEARGSAPLPGGISQLGATANTPATPSLAREVAVAFKSLLEQLATPEKLATPEGLRRALLESGIFFEQRLAVGGHGPELASDLKSALIKLITLLRPFAQPGAALPATPGGKTPEAAGQAGAQPPPGSMPEMEHEAQQLLRDAEGALARVKMHQLQSLPTAEKQEPGYLLEVPVRQGDRTEVMELKIEREERRNGAGDEPVWSVRLAYTDPGFGHIAMVVNLTGRHRVGTTFWAERAGTTDLFRDQLPMLEERLRAAGFEVTALAARPGRPPSDDSRVEQPALLNVRA